MYSAPILVGVGVATQRHDNPLDALNPLALMQQATNRAGLEAPGLLPKVDRILIPKGRWTYPDPGRHIANAIGATGAKSVLSTVGVLQQTLIGNACAAIASGDARAALVVGGDAGYRILRAGIAGIELPEPEADGTPDELLAPKEELRHPAELRAGMRMPVGLWPTRGWSVRTSTASYEGVRVMTHVQSDMAIGSRVKIDFRDVGQSVLPIASPLD